MEDAPGPRAEAALAPMGGGVVLFLAPSLTPLQTPSQEGAGKWGEMGYPGGWGGTELE